MLIPGAYRMTQYSPIVLFNVALLNRRLGVGMELLLGPVLLGSFGSLFSSPGTEGTQETSPDSLSGNRWEPGVASKEGINCR